MLQKPVLTPKEAAAALGVSYKTILRQNTHKNKNPRQLGGGPGAGRGKEAKLLWLF